MFWKTPFMTTKQKVILDLLWGKREPDAMCWLFILVIQNPIQFLSLQHASYRVKN